MCQHGRGVPRTFSRQALRNPQTEVLLELPYNPAPRPWAPHGPAASSHTHAAQLTQAASHAEHTTIRHAGP